MVTTAEVASDTEPVAGPDRAGPPISARTAAIAVGVLAVFAFVLALVVQHGLFPLTSLNHDEPIYLVSADMLQHGELTLPGDQAEFFRPWASGVREGEVVLKYPPVWPAVLAVADVVTSPGVGVALTAAAVAVLGYLLVAELGASRRAALLTAVMLTLSPIVVFQSGTMLPYLFLLALVLGAYYLVLRGVRTGGALWLAGGGAVLGVALFARPFDAVLAAIPLAVLILATDRLGARAWQRLGWIALGAAPLVVLTLAFNAYAMGEPFSFPFSVTGPDDRLGFGRRGVFPSDTTNYSLRAAVQATWDNLTALPAWVFGGVLTLGLAVLGLLRSRALDGRKWAVAGLALSIPIGYFAFWGPYAMSALWDGLEALGPFYHLPMVVPLAVFAGIELDRLLTRRALVAGITMVAMLGLTVVAIVPAVERNFDETDDYESIDATIDAADLDNAILFVDYTPETGFEARTPFLYNDADLNQSVLYAYDRGGGDFALIDQYPDRSLARLESVLDPAAADDGFSLGGFLLPDRHPFRSNIVVTPLTVERSRVLRETLRATNPVAGASVTAYGAASGVAPVELVLDDDARAGASADVTWTVGVDPGGQGPTIDLAAAEPAGEIVLGVRITPDDGTEVRAYEWRYAYRVTDDGVVEVLIPGSQWALHDDMWYRQNVEDVLSVQ